MPAGVKGIGGAGAGRVLEDGAAVVRRETTRPGRAQANRNRSGVAHVCCAYARPAATAPRPAIVSIAAALSHQRRPSYRETEGLRAADTGATKVHQAGVRAILKLRVALLRRVDAATQRTVAIAGAWLPAHAGAQAGRGSRLRR